MHPTSTRFQPVPGDPVLGILKGEGSSPEIVDATLCVLEAAADRFDLRVVLQVGGRVGCESAAETGEYLSREVIQFCGDIFRRGGAILAGAGGGRFVYDLRREFGLFCKLNPIRSYPELKRVCRLKSARQPVDILIVRENLGGLYQGRSRRQDALVVHQFSQDEEQVQAVLRVATEAAAGRRKRLAVVGKESGLPGLHALWRNAAMEQAARREVEVTLLDIDFASYKLLQEPESFDVIAAPNCFGDILSDLGGVIAGSRGLTFGGSFSSSGAAVYQTNHGSAKDLAGTDTANPAGQIFSLAMLLRESFGRHDAAAAVEQAVGDAWRGGCRTRDVAEPGCEVVGTSRFGQRVAAEIRRKFQKAGVSREACATAD